MSFRTGLGIALLVVAGCSSSTASPSSSSSGTPPPGFDPGEAPPEANSTEPPVAFSEREVQALFDKKCGRCHGATSENLDLSGSFEEKTVGVKPAGSRCGGGRTKYGLRIAAGSRDKSLLWHKVKGTQDCGSAMPYERGDVPLDTTELERLGLYIDGLPH